MRRGPIILCAIGVAAVVCLWWTGIPAELANPEAVEARLKGLGALGPLIFIALIVALLPVFLIGPPIWSASAVWPPLWAVAYSTLGCILASWLIYALARRLGREWAQKRIPDRLRPWENRLVEHPFRTVVLMRVLIWANPAVDLLIGISRVKTRDYLLGTIVGLIPPTFVHVLFVGKGFQLALTLPGWFWGALAGGIAVAFAMRAFFSRRPPP